MCSSDESNEPPRLSQVDKEPGIIDNEKVTKFASHDSTPHHHASTHFANEDLMQHRARTSKLLRKIDLHLLPFLILMYLLNFLDRSNLAQARQGTLEKDLGMKGTDFNLATSIFFVAYLLMQLPSNMLITRVRPSLYLSAAMTLWGVVSTCNAATHSFGGLIAVRFMLGFVEAPFFPGAIFLMSSWYTRAELTRRISWFYSGSALANMFGGLLGAAILGNLDGNFGLAGWRWLFIIEGTITIGIAILAVFFLPDYPTTTSWLSEEEKTFAAWRLLADVNEEDDRHAQSMIAGLKLALQDYRLYLFVIFQHISLLSQTFQYFFPAIVGTLGYGAIDTLWLTAPVWVRTFSFASPTVFWHPIEDRNNVNNVLLILKQFATFLVSIFVTWTSARTGDRSIHIMCLMMVAVVGNSICTATTNIGARFFAMFLMPMGAVSAYQIIVSWVANSFPRPLVKRSISIAIANMIGNTASIYGSYMYPASASPRYVPGGTANTVICFSVAVMALSLRFVLIHENKKLEREEADDVANGGTAKIGVDRRSLGFRYVY